MTELSFRKSSYSTVEGECVEVAVNVPGTVAIRDSKDPAPEAPILHISPSTWTAFTTSLR